MLFLDYSSTSNTLLLLFASLLLVHLVYRYSRRLQASTTPLNGPPNPSWLFGASRLIARSSDPGGLYEQWQDQYGPVYTVPATFGKPCVVLSDPKAIQHFYARETEGYQHTPLLRALAETLIGRGLFWAEGDTHRRHRKALAPAFSLAALKDMLPIFHDTAHKVQAAWDNIILAQSPSSDSAIVDVHSWMNRVSFDTFGVTGFGRDFGTLRGEHNTVMSAIDAFSGMKADFAGCSQFILGLVFPLVLRFPTAFRRISDQFDAGMSDVVNEILAEAREEKQIVCNSRDRSIMGLLLKAEKSSSELRMSSEEILAQMKLLMVTGYITTSNCLMWCLVELCKKPEIQDKLRLEVSRLPSGDAAWEQLIDGLPYLDAVLHETLRLHPPLGDTTRVAVENDIIPLFHPVKTATGASVDRIFISKGQLVTVPIQAINTSPRFWGPDAKEFQPERFLTEGGIPKQIPGHKHLLTFVSGPRLCLGRHYALAEAKAVLCLLVRSYAFEFADGPDTQTGINGWLLSRPIIPGGDGQSVPLRVRRLDSTYV
ncbi:cytochrome P450 [Fomitopsis serialis]|uniref:cytochrome P450 n=1 Tax=Fomitopsis serialis TaxID=139415 RepID=UPI002007E373|nr:cytochrome P450 [Neoantrodia serialis]KAH9928826.1 cytochrome P450 [Neoantrodia serialis]